MPTLLKRALAKRKLLQLFLVSALWLTSTGAREAGASASIFQFFGAICVTVYDLRDGDPGDKLADTFADAIAPGLQADARTRNRFIKVYTRRDCIKPDQPGFEQQLRLSLYVNRQTISVQDRLLNVVVVGGSTFNACGPLCAHNMQPVILADSGNVPDKAIERALEEFTRRNVLRFIRD
jgi:hypothetical protein